MGLPKRRRSIPTGPPSSRFGAQICAAAAQLKRVFTCERRRHEVLKQHPDSHCAEDFVVWGDYRDPSNKLDAFSPSVDDFYVPRPKDIERPKTAARPLLSEWHKLAECLLKRGIPPAEYVRLYFSKLPSLGEVPQLQQLASEQAIAGYWELRQDFVMQQRSKFRAQAASAARKIRLLQDPGDLVEGLSVVDATLWVLRDEGNTLTPLFRYCVAAREAARDPRFAELEERYYTAAALQLAQNCEGYVAAWDAGWIPESLQRDAEHVYNAYYFPGCN